MNDAWKNLLEATIEHVKALNRQGITHVPVAPETLAALSRPREASPAPVVENEPAPARELESTRVRPGRPPSIPGEPAQVSFADLLSETPERIAEPMSPEAKAAAMAELRERVLVCEQCPHLASARRNVVFGVGDIHSPILFVGEAPGADEDEQGEPFVGRAGQLLTRIIQTMEFSRETVYIANILKCRPDTPTQASGNRRPTAEEMKTCLPHLLRQIEIIQPQVIVALGATAVEGLFGKATAITRLRGQWLSFRGIPVMPTYHPAYLLRNQSTSEKRKVWEDMLKVLERLGRPVSEKQRSYFLRP